MVRLAAGVRRVSRAFCRAILAHRRRASCRLLERGEAGADCPEEESAAAAATASAACKSCSTLARVSSPVGICRRTVPAASRRAARTSGSMVALKNGESRQDREMGADQGAARTRWFVMTKPAGPPASRRSRELRPPRRPLPRLDRQAGPFRPQPEGTARRRRDAAAARRGADGRGLRGGRVSERTPPARQVAVERRRCHPQAMCHLLDADGRVAQHRLGGRQIDPVQGTWPSSPPSVRPGGIEPGAGPLADDRALELGRRGEEVEHQPTPEVVVSTASVSERNPTRRASRPSTVSISCLSERASRSSFHTTSVSPWRM